MERARGGADQVTELVGGRAHRSPSAPGVEARSSTSPSCESRQTSTFLRLRFNPASNIKTGRPRQPLSVTHSASHSGGPPSCQILSQRAAAVCRRCRICLQSKAPGDSWSGCSRAAPCPSNSDRARPYARVARYLAQPNGAPVLGGSGAPPVISASVEGGIGLTGAGMRSQGRRGHPCPPGPQKRGRLAGSRLPLPEHYPEHHPPDCPTPDDAQSREQSPTNIRSWRVAARRPRRGGAGRVLAHAGQEPSPPCANARTPCVRKRTQPSDCPDPSRG